MMTFFELNCIGVSILIRIGTYLLFVHEFFEKNPVAKFVYLAVVYFSELHLLF